MMNQGQKVISNRTRKRQRINGQTSLRKSLIGHLVMPQVVKLFAAGRYGSDAENNTFFKDDSGNWQQIVTLEVSREGFRLIYPEKTAVQKPLKKKNK